MHRTIHQSSATAAAQLLAAPVGFSLDDRSVLCVGGLTGARNHYRLAIE